ncbi:S8 family peptidase [Haloarchaeobius sp. DFWS5]|uniref:S8 family peptidase n=1 Tax=Haloarchaeobius sp. DFWS5 TaxID=3446114 RepID=UPI003EBEB3ED
MSITRRSVLRRITVGAVTGGVVGTASSGVGRGWDSTAADEYVVGIRGLAGLEWAQQLSTQVWGEFDFGAEIGQAVVGRFPAAALDVLQQSPLVRYVETNGTMHTLEQTVPWGVDRIGAMAAQAMNRTGQTASGEPIHVAVIDSGIDSDHPDLSVNLGDGVSFVGCTDCGVGNVCRESWDDDVGHGTHVAGIIAALANGEGVVGVAPDVRVHAVKVTDCNGEGSVANAAAAIKYVADRGWHVANLSLGGSGSRLLADAVTYATERGVVLVAAAGNDGPCSDCVNYPAAYLTVLGVSAVDDDGALATFSSAGYGVDLCAPGVGIWSAFTGGGYEWKEGTSMASPHVAAAAALLLADGETHETVRDSLTATAEDLGLAPAAQGAGLVRVDWALGVEESADGVVAD